MSRNRKCSPKFKAKVALEAIKGDKTISQIASEYGEVPPENWTGDNIHFERGYEKMGRNRKYTSQFKAKVAFEAAKGDKTISQIASEYGIHPQQVRIWKREFLENLHLVFEKEDQAKELKKALDKAYKKIGQLEVEKDFLSKILDNY